MSVKGPQIKPLVVCEKCGWKAYKSPCCECYNRSVKVKAYQKKKEKERQRLNGNPQT
jgi:ribosomal protein L37E